MLELCYKDGLAQQPNNASFPLLLEYDLVAFLQA